MHTCFLLDCLLYDVVSSAYDAEYIKVFVKYLNSLLNMFKISNGIKVFVLCFKKSVGIAQTFD